MLVTHEACTDSTVRVNYQPVICRIYVGSLSLASSFQTLYHLRFYCGIPSLVPLLPKLLVSSRNECKNDLLLERG